ncbi:MAG: T9SS type A sorting domain-containing protein [Saprospiraceae bacterium]|nr:T9SS type A sorting domain-containing protein [Saprospiraceae bacterium]
MGTLFTIFSCFSITLKAQCDYINNITGIVQSTMPVGDASNPALYTHTYVLVDNQGNIYATNTTPDFLSIPAGFYNLYAVNYINTEAGAVLPLLTVGQPWFNVEVYGNDNVNYCLDFTPAFGTGCPIVVCDQLSICEIDTLLNPSFNFNTIGHEQSYCLVCNDIVLAIDLVSSFPLQDYPAATVGANCQLFGINYDNIGNPPISVGDNWSLVTDLLCTSLCFDFIGMDLDITPITQPSGNGISTTVDWWSGGCLGAQPPVNAGNNFLEVVNNWCVPSFNPGPINARPDEGGGSMDDLQLLMGGREVFSRFPCVGTMDLSQNTIFYTVECSPFGPSQLDVLVSNAGAGITMIEAALYGPVNPLCPTFTGGSFVDCNDAGVGSQSGNSMGNITLTTNGNPGEVYLVIVDTDGTDQFTISSSIILLNNTMVSFYGHKDKNHNVLYWETEEEKNVKNYELQRSNDAINFINIAQIPALNNGSLYNNYSYVDALAGVGSKYYRVKTTELDGIIEYSNIVVLSRGLDNLGTVSIFPNPTEGLFYVEFESNVKTQIDYKIQDVIGQTVFKGTSEINQGLNKLELNLEDYPASTYIISLTMDGQTIQRKLIKE